MDFDVYCDESHLDLLTFTHPNGEYVVNQNTKRIKSTLAKETHPWL